MSALDRLKEMKELGQQKGVVLEAIQNLLAEQKKTNQLLAEILKKCDKHG